MSAADYPATWPGTQIIKSVHSPFNWRRPGDSTEPLNAGIRATAMPAKRGPKKKATGGISGHNGTIQGLSKRADKIITIKPNPTLIKASGQGNHGGAYSKAVAA